MSLVLLLAQITPLADLSRVAYHWIYNSFRYHITPFHCCNVSITIKEKLTIEQNDINSCHVLQFHVLQFHALQFGPSFSCLKRTRARHIDMTRLHVIHHPSRLTDWLPWFTANQRRCPSQRRFVHLSFVRCLDNPANGKQAPLAVLANFSLNSSNSIVGSKAIQYRQAES